MSVFSGKSLRIEIYGASHAEEIGVIASGLPEGIRIDMDRLLDFMHRRSPGSDPLFSSRHEVDKPIFLSGIRNDTTDGTPLRAIIKNNDVRKSDYVNLKHIPRPGHADLCAWQKYGLEHDMSGGGEFSGRMTAALCIIGGILIQELERKGICISAKAVSSHESIELRDEAELARAVGNSVGALVKCHVIGLPAGIGGELFDGLDAAISRLIFAIPGVKGIEFGAGFSAAKMFGTENNDEYAFENGKLVYLSNNCGGILGGISTGTELEFSVAMKPTPSVAVPQKSVDLTTGENVELKVSGRHDPCFALRTPPIVEAVTAIALSDIMLTDWKYSELSELRKRIDRIDEGIISLIEERLSVCSDIADFKAANLLPIYDGARESEKLGTVPDELRSIFKEIIKISREFQEDRLNG